MKKLLTTALICLTTIVLWAQIEPGANGIIYVKPTVAGNGSGISWANATDNLQAAINAPGVYQVWVAAGTYQPASGISYQMKNDVAIYGGFPVTGMPVFADRNWVVHETILKGNMASVIKNINLGSASIASTSILDGFTITNGYAAGANGKITYSSTPGFPPTAQNGGNGFGGGIYNENSSASFRNLVISNNTAKGGEGVTPNGTVMAYPGSGFGGGIYNTNSSPVLTNVIIKDNTVIGGAFYFAAGHGYGGGIYNTNASSPILTNVLIGNNTAQGGTGLIGGNGEGGGINNQGASIPVLTNVTIANNVALNMITNAATGLGGAIYNSGSSDVKIINSIVYGNNSGIQNVSSTPVISYSLVQGLAADATNHNLDGATNPLFVSATDYQLQISSPVLNKGSNSYYAGGQTPNLSAITTDLANNPRFYGTVDLGAYEFRIPAVVPNVIVYVSQNGAGTKDGSSWANATFDLQQAIQKSSDKVFVAGGTYRPIYPADTDFTGTYLMDLGNRKNAFVLRKDVKIYGGFNATMPEPSLDLRDTTAASVHKSILTGDFNGDDGANFANNTENACHVLIAAGDVGSAAINGFTVTAGNANVLNDGVNVNGEGFYSSWGGGLVIENSRPLLSNLRFIGNSGEMGGGIFIGNDNNLKIKNTEISGNQSPSGGGGVLNGNRSTLELDQVIISGNKSGGFGGGIYSGEVSYLNIKHSTISDNIAASHGGGIYNSDYHSGLSVANTVISNNITTEYGGGIYIGGGTATLDQVTIKGNAADQGGGISNGTSMQLSNTLISGNYATTRGGGIENNGWNMDFTLTNTSIAGNNAPTGGAVYSIVTNTSIRNCIIYGNSTGIDDVYPLSNPVISYSLIQGLAADATNHNLEGTLNPLFTNAPAASTAPFSLGDYTLQINSPVVNKGSNSFYALGQTPDLSDITTDLAGNTRINGTVDLGAYEFEPTAVTVNEIVYVSQTGAGTKDGSSWNNATNDLQQAIQKSTAKVYVAAGTYKPVYPANTDFSSNYIMDPGNRSNAFLLKKDVKVYGGFNATTPEASPNLRDTTTTSGGKSILSGDFNGDDGTDFANNTENAYHVVISANNVATAEINGFTVTAGNASGSGSLTVNGQNIVAVSGGGIHNSLSSPTIRNVISHSNAASAGGGMYNFNNSKPMVMNVSIVGNKAANGAGIFNDNYAHAVMSNVLISGNVASNQGGGINNAASNPVLSNVTISGNTAVDGGGMHNNNGSNPKIRNSIIYGNSSGMVNNNATPTISYSIVQASGGSNAWEAATGINGGYNLDLDPLYTNAPTAGSAPFVGGNYTLQTGSPAINVGSDSFYASGQTPDLSAITTDLAGRARVQKGTIDLGAYESAFDIALQPDANGIIYVKTTATGSGNGSSWVNATEKLQDAINTAGVGQVWVAAGNYQLANGTSYTMKNGVAIYGGFAGTETNFNERRWEHNLTVLTGNNESVVKNDFSAATPLNATAVLDGFCITGGAASYGSGIYNKYASATFVHLLITANGRPFFLGGGMYNDQSSPTLTNVSIVNNNIGDGDGAGMYNKDGSSPVLTNVLISKNVGANGSGIYNTNGSSPILTNVSIVDNEASNNGGAMVNDAANPIIRNSIIYNNTSGIYDDNGSVPVISYSLVQGLASTANGNVDGSVDPLFTSNTNYTLQLGSPVIDAGNSSFYANGQTPDLSFVTTDLAGNNRMNGTVDMGAYEYMGTLPVTLVSYIARAENNGSKLVWQTANEQNNESFTISRSSNGLDFTAIGTVMGKGNSTALSNYSFLDVNPENGINYYRLQQKDFNGKVTDLGIRSVSFNFTDLQITVYPNPTSGMANIKFSAGLFQKAELIDLNGKLMQSKIIRQQDLGLSFDLTALPSAMYILKLSGAGQTVIKKLLRK